MTRNGVLSMSLTVGTMNLAKHGSPLWVAIEKNTGLFAFAEDEVAAAERLRKVVTITLDTAMTQGGMDAVHSYLDNNGVSYSELVQTQESETWSRGIELAEGVVRAYLDSREAASGKEVESQGRNISSRRVEVAYATS